MRNLFVRLHRWFGLGMAVFLTIAGLTGAVIAFNHELDEMLNPELFSIQETSAAIPTFELVRQIEAKEPRLQVTYTILKPEPGHALVLGVAARQDPKTQQPYELGFTEVFVNPVTGAWLGEREWGACCFERKQLLPFLYLLHYSLHMPERWGIWLMGLVALVWILDCFIGFYLTLPHRQSEDGEPVRKDGRSFWQRWKPAWKVKFKASRSRLNFDLHRAGGLWFWALLLMLAVSGVYLNLQFELFRPLVSLVAPITPSPFDVLTPAALPRAPLTPSTEPTADAFQKILDRARLEGRQRGWVEPFDIYKSPDPTYFGVGFGDHHAPGLGVPWVYFNSEGVIIEEDIPGEGTGADRFMQWLFPLHSGQILGLPSRILISITGLIVAMLSVTGVLIWMKKRRGALALQRRQAQEVPPPASVLVAAPKA